MKLRRDNRRQFLLLAGLALVVTLPLAGSRPLWEPDEGRYAEAAREMVVSQDWVTPQLNFEPHMSKPPMTYWFIALGLKLFGQNEFGARFFLSLAFCATVLLTAAIAIQLDRAHSAFASGLVYLSSLLPFIAGQVLTSDSFLTFFETLAVYFFFRASHPSVTRPRFLVWGFYATLGAAFLTKGPPGLLPPLAAILGWSLFRRQQGTLRKFFSPAGLLFFAGISLSWYSVVSLRNPELLRYFIYEEVIGRIFTNMHNRDNPWYIYLPVLLVGSLPWVAYWLRPFVRFLDRLCRKGWKSCDPYHGILAVWILVPLCVFFLARSRLILYVLPLFVPISLWAGDIIAERWQLTSAGAARQIFACRRGQLIVGWLFVLIAGIFGAKYYSTWRDMKPLAQAIRGYAAGRPFDVSLIGHSPKYGLSFYLGQPYNDIEREARPNLSHPHPDFLTYLSQLKSDHPLQIFLLKRTDIAWLLGHHELQPEFFYANKRYSLFSLENLPVRQGSE